MMKLFTIYFSAIFLLSIPCCYAQSPVAKPADIFVDLFQKKALMEPIWALFGYDEPNYTYMKDGRKLLSELAALRPGSVYVRTHSLLVIGDGEADNHSVAHYCYRNIFYVQVRGI